MPRATGGIILFSNQIPTAECFISLCVNTARVLDVFIIDPLLLGQLQACWVEGSLTYQLKQTVLRVVGSLLIEGIKQLISLLRVANNKH